ncbi:MAG TPA: crosslink repair DNA glycosylase YcaQ family protein [Fimbriimonas sp.]|nr:crosslink repair DNA glycosylase YcaQ family protein [Fimbriimonas sp.]
MSGAVQLSKADARRALVRHHFAFSQTPFDVFARLKSVQFDPISPIGCNHDLVLHAHTSGYKIGDWEALAYRDRKIYDGWDKQASLVPFEGWPLRRIFHKVHRQSFEKRVFQDLKEEADLVYREIAERGPLMPKELSYQKKSDEPKGTWHSQNLTKRILRGLWHSGLIMTAGRKGGQHIYDLTERVVPRQFFKQPVVEDSDARRQLVLERHQTMGILRPNATAEIWSYGTLFYEKKHLIPELLKQGAIVPVEVEGMKANSTHGFLQQLEQGPPEPRVVFVAPLDPFLWDRKMTAQLFGFDYAWEIYMPEAKRRWGYYVLPVLYGDRLVARVEFWARKEIIEVRQWHWEEGDPGAGFWEGLEKAAQELMAYASAVRFAVREHIDAKVRSFFDEISKGS